MKLLVFGATGMVGTHVVNQALHRGHTVRAFGRNVWEMTQESEQLEKVKGALFDAGEVKKALQGVDAVISVIGGGTDGTDKTRSLGMKNIIAQMETTGVKRIIALGGAGILQANEEMMIFQTEGFPKEYLPVSEEHFASFSLLQQSRLNWTFVCPPHITDESPTGLFAVESNYPPTPNNGQIGAGDLVLFMLNELEKNEMVHTRVGICKK
jgi:uncharacterized protein